MITFFTLSNPFHIFPIEVLMPQSHSWSCLSSTHHKLYHYSLCISNTSTPTRHTHHNLHHYFLFLLFKLLNCLYLVNFLKIEFKQVVWSSTRIPVQLTVGCYRVVLVLGLREGKIVASIYCSCKMHGFFFFFLFS
jgi:hypothetical protein